MSARRTSATKTAATTPAKTAKARAGKKAAAAAPSIPHGQALALLCAKAISDIGAEQIRVLALPTGQMAFDYVVIGSARSDRQIGACAEEVRQTLKKGGITHRGGIEGASGWLLVDAYEVIVHMFLESERERYDLDHLWPQAVEVPFSDAAPLAANPAAPKRAEKRAAKPLPVVKVTRTRSKARPAKGSTVKFMDT